MSNSYKSFEKNTVKKECEQKINNKNDFTPFSNGFRLKFAK